MEETQAVGREGRRNTYEERVANENFYFKLAFGEHKWLMEGLVSYQAHAYATFQNVVNHLIRHPIFSLF